MPTTAVPTVLTDPGFLFWAPLGSAEPTNTVVGSKFTDSWPVAWINLGATDGGSTFTYSTKVDPVKVAEFFDPISWKTTERSGNFTFALANVSLANLNKVFNGGTLAVVSGTTTTQLNSYVPPTPGTEVRAMIGWESLDSTMRLVCYQTFQGGNMALQFHPLTSADKTVIPATFNLEVPSAGNPFKLYTAGTARA